MLATCLPRIEQRLRGSVPSCVTSTQYQMVREVGGNFQHGTLIPPRRYERDVAGCHRGQAGQAGR